jgi:hypothetical protein
MANTIIVGLNDQATLLQQYKDAVEAYNDLLLGNKLEEGSHSVERMKFSRSTPAALAAYNSNLAGQLAAFGINLPGRRLQPCHFLQHIDMCRFNHTPACCIN